MWFQLSKVTQLVLLCPLFWCLICNLITIVLLRRAKSKAAAVWLCLSCAALLIPSLPIVSGAMVAHLENFAPARRLEEYSPADAIVVLGGSTSPLVSPRQTAQEVYGSRVYIGYQLFRLGKAKKILVAGGLPYVGRDGGIRTESTDMKEILISMGVPSSAIIEENTSRTTQENAANVSAMLPDQGIKNVLLVTSALHLRRAAAHFRKNGIAFVPVPAEYQISSDLKLIDQIPSARYLDLFSSALKEYLGYFAVN